MSKPLEDAVRRRLPSEEVFERVVCLGWYDGPLSGMLKCRGEDPEYRFDLVDDADVLNYRVFTIALLPAGTIGRFVALLGHLGHECPPQPNRSIWVPLWRFPSDKDRIAADAATERILSAASEPVAAFCWNLVEDVITACRGYGSSDRCPNDWFSWFGMERPGERTDMSEDEEA